MKMPDAEHNATLLFNPLWKALARHLASRCDECGQERLLSVFDYYSESGGFNCKKCLLTSKAMWPLIRLLFFGFRINNNAVKRLLNDPLIRKCMLSVIKGIASFGIRYPQPAGVPVTIV